MVVEGVSVGRIFEAELFRAVEFNRATWIHPHAYIHGRCMHAFARVQMQRARNATRIYGRPSKCTAPGRRERRSARVRSTPRASKRSIRLAVAPQWHFAAARILLFRERRKMLTTDPPSLNTRVHRSCYHRDILPGYFVSSFVARLISMSFRGYRRLNDK